MRGYVRGDVRNLPVIAEEYDAGEWGSDRRAIAARTKRAKELEERGYTVDYSKRYRGLLGIPRYRLWAYRDERVVRGVRPS